MIYNLVHKPNSNATNQIGPSKINKFSPLFGQSSQLGSVTPALHASQNQGSVEAELTVLDSLVVSDTP